MFCFRFFFGIFSYFAFNLFYIYFYFEKYVSTKCISFRKCYYVVTYKFNFIANRDLLTKNWPRRSFQIELKQTSNSLFSPILHFTVHKDSAIKLRKFGETKRISLCWKSFGVLTHRLLIPFDKCHRSFLWEVNQWKVSILLHCWSHQTLIYVKKKRA